MVSNVNLLHPYVAVRYSVQPSSVPTHDVTVSVEAALGDNVTMFSLGKEAKRALLANPAAALAGKGGGV